MMMMMMMRGPIGNALSNFVPSCFLTHSLFSRSYIMATRRRSKRLESRVVSCSNEVSVSVVVVEFSTRTLNIVLRDHFLFYFVLN